MLLKEEEKCSSVIESNKNNQEYDLSLNKEKEIPNHNQSAIQTVVKRESFDITNEKGVIPKNKLSRRFGKGIEKEKEDLDKSNAIRDPIKFPKDSHPPKAINEVIILDDEATVSLEKESTKCRNDIYESPTMTDKAKQDAVQSELNIENGKVLKTNSKDSNNGKESNNNDKSNRDSNYTEKRSSKVGSKQTEKSLLCSNGGFGRYAKYCIRKDSKQEEERALNTIQEINSSSKEQETSCSINTQLQSTNIESDPVFFSTSSQNSPMYNPLNNLQDLTLKESTVSVKEPFSKDTSFQKSEIQLESTVKVNEDQNSDQNSCIIISVSNSNNSKSNINNDQANYKGQSFPSSSNTVQTLHKKSASPSSEVIELTNDSKASSSNKDNISEYSNLTLRRNLDEQLTIKSTDSEPTKRWKLLVKLCPKGKKVAKIHIRRKIKGLSEYQKRLKRVLCTTCCKFGHETRDCPVKKCFLCNSLDHTSIDCVLNYNNPEYYSTNKEKIARCGLCLAYGHSSKQCLNVLKKGSTEESNSNIDVRGIYEWYDEVIEKFASIKKTYWDLDSYHSKQNVNMIDDRKIFGLERFKNCVVSENKSQDDFHFWDKRVCVKVKYCIGCGDELDDLKEFQCEECKDFFLRKKRTKVSRNFFE
mmetsp:Transcript_4619/g.4804  ORF Transcript_4619/g.4804 Transcript_4619/m.4804 type:complete len:643 (+) Transcript_4619:3-1931(+)